MNNISNISEKDFDKNNNGQIFYQDISVLNNNTTSKDDSVIDDIQLAKAFYKKDNLNHLEFRTPKYIMMNEKE